jgi:hypothetical protein
VEYKPIQWRKAFEKLIVGHLLKKFPIFYEIRRFITLFTRACQWNINIYLLCEICGVDAVPVACVMINDEGGFWKLLVLEGDCCLIQFVIFCL